MWRSPSINHNASGDKLGVQYPIEKLDLLINYIGSSMSLRNDLDELWDMDRMCDMHCCHFLRKITNGEYFYALYEIFQELTSPQPAKDLVAYKEGILTELFNAATDDALDMILNHEWDNAKETAEDLWTLYEFSCAKNGLPIWSDDNGKEKKPPQLKKMKAEDWDLVISTLFEELFWDLDYTLFGHFSTYKEQPHYPTFPEFRKALIWFEEAYQNTRVNGNNHNKAELMAEAAKYLGVKF